jgi:protein disulfide-isomerase
MKHLLLTLVVSLLAFNSLNAQAAKGAKTVKTPKTESPATLTWYTDVVKASEVSNATGKPLFAFFTGSDWCIWCKRLQADVFAKKKFIDWANKNVVLVELDFPRTKALSPELQQQNNSLQQTFGVQGYPTIWMFFLTKAADGTKFDIKPLGSTGYPGGAIVGKEEDKFLENANELLKKKDLK